MTRPQRRIHAAVWFALLPGLLAGVAWLLTTREPFPVQPPLAPAADAPPAGPSSPAEPAP